MNAITNSNTIIKMKIIEINLAYSKKNTKRADFNLMGHKYSIQWINALGNNI